MAANVVPVVVLGVLVKKKRFHFTTDRRIYTLSKKTAKFFCQNFVKFPPTVKIFDKRMAKRIGLHEVHIFSTSPNLCRRTTVLNADVPGFYRATLCVARSL